MKTLTIFRRWSDGQVIALFPLEPGTNSPATCMSYMHIGQHGAADPFYVVAITDPATPEQYAPLARELEGLGYTLDIRSRVPANAYAKRQAALSVTK